MTRIRVLLVLSMVALGSVLAGCNGSNCVSLCQEAEGRGCNSFDLGTGSCEEDCALAERLADKGGCQAQKDARLDCEARQADICEEGCGAEDRALAQCVTNYCLANPGDPDCGLGAGL